MNVFGFGVLPVGVHAMDGIEPSGPFVRQKYGGEKVKGSLGLWELKVGARNLKVKVGVNTLRRI